MPTKVIIVGGGFAGLSAAKMLGGLNDVNVTLIDRRNHHLFQPLLYQVATAGLSPADIAAPIRNILSRFKNITVLLGTVEDVDLDSKVVLTDFGPMEYDYLVLACGATHSYFGHDDWEDYAPGLKTIEDATDIRRRILIAYEKAERCGDSDQQRRLLTFVIVGGGPTGVELAGAIGEMSRFTLAKDFRTIDAKSTRVFLMEAGPRILAAFPKELADRASRDLEKLGVQIWTSSRVTEVSDDGVTIGEERIQAATVIWAAGVRASRLGQQLNLATDQLARVIVEKDLSVPHYPNVLVAGDQAHFKTKGNDVLPGLAPVAIQQGRHIAKLIKSDLAGRNRSEFRYRDKGMSATIGRNKAVLKSGRLQMTGRMAWLTWLVIHIYFLTGFRNRLFVVLQWAWSYVSHRRGARLIVGAELED